MADAGRAPRPRLPPPPAKSQSPAPPPAPHDLLHSSQSADSTSTSRSAPPARSELGSQPPTSNAQHAATHAPRRRHGPGHVSAGTRSWSTWKSVFTAAREEQLQRNSELKSTHDASHTYDHAAPARARAVDQPPSAERGAASTPPALVSAASRTMTTTPTSTPRPGAPTPNFSSLHSLRRRPASPSREPAPCPAKRSRTSVEARGLDHADVQTVHAVASAHAMAKRPAAAASTLATTPGANTGTLSTVSPAARAPFDPPRLAQSTPLATPPAAAAVTRPAWLPPLPATPGGATPSPAAIPTMSSSSSHAWAWMRAHGEQERFAPRFAKLGDESETIRRLSSIVSPRPTAPTVSDATRAPTSASSTPSLHLTPPNHGTGAMAMTSSAILNGRTTEQAVPAPPSSGRSPTYASCPAATSSLATVPRLPARAGRTPSFSAATPSPSLPWTALSPSTPSTRPRVSGTSFAWSTKSPRLRFGVPRPPPPGASPFVGRCTSAGDHGVPSALPSPRSIFAPPSLAPPPPPPAAPTPSPRYADEWARFHATGPPHPPTVPANESTIWSRSKTPSRAASCTRSSPRRAAAQGDTSRRDRSLPPGPAPTAVEMRAISSSVPPSREGSEAGSPPTPQLRSTQTGRGHPGVIQPRVGQRQAIVIVPVCRTARASPVVEAQRDVQPPTRPPPTAPRVDAAHTLGPVHRSPPVPPPQPDAAHAPGSVRQFVHDLPPQLRETRSFAAPDRAQLSPRRDQSAPPRVVTFGGCEPVSRPPTTPILPRERPREAPVPSILPNRPQFTMPAALRRTPEPPEPPPCKSPPPKDAAPGAAVGPSVPVAAVPLASAEAVGGQERVSRKCTTIVLSDPESDLDEGPRSAHQDAAPPEATAASTRPAPSLGLASPPPAFPPPFLLPSFSPPPFPHPPFPHPPPPPLSMFGLYQPAPVVMNDVWERWDDDDWWDVGLVEGEMSVEDEETAEDEESVEDEGPVESEEDDENEDEDDDEGSIAIVGSGDYGEIYSEGEYDDDDEEELEAKRAPLPLEGPMILFPLGIEPRPLSRFRWRAKLRPVNMRLSEPMIILNPAAREFEYDSEERRWTVGERLDWE